MGQYEKQWARRKRAELTVELGSLCVNCKREDDLEFDCIIPQGDKHHKMDTSARMSFYRAQHRNGNIQLLCEKCHRIKSASEQPEVVEESVNPF